MLRIAIVVLLSAGSFWLAPAALADQCTSVTFERQDYNPLGTCWSDAGKACTSDNQCTSGSKDFCVKAVCDNDPARFCTNSSQCGGGTCTEDITFTFDRPLECGQFVNGDWWVAADGSGSVNITSMTPAHTSACESGGNACRNGWDYDLKKGEAPYSGRAFTTSSSPSLPRTFTPGSKPVSVIKSIDGGQTDCDYPSGSYCSAVLHAAVLTIVPADAKPPAYAFRPGYAGPDKQSGYYTINDIDLSKMPRIPSSSLADRSSMPSMASVQKYNDGPFLGLNRVNAELYGIIAHNQGTHGYHAVRAGASNRYMLRLLIDGDYENDPVHQQALYGTIQQGIDKAWTLKNWARHSTPQRRIKNMAVPIMFAAFMLGDTSLADTGFPNMSEQDTFYDSPRYGAGHPADHLWGYACTESTYWSRSSSGKATDKWCGDPYGYVEASLLSASGSYQQCCSMGPWKGGALMVHLMQMNHVMNVESFLHVMGRFWDGWASDPSFGQGYWAKPDPCQANGGVKSGNPGSCHITRSCECKSGSGRYTSAHNKLSTYGDAPGQPGYQDAFSNAMWDSFRACAAPVKGDGATSTSFPCTGMATPDGTPIPPPPPPGGGSGDPQPGDGGGGGSTPRMDAPFWK